LDEAMAMIAERVVETRAANWQDKTDSGDPANRTLAIANLGGATLDNEENYLIKKLCVALGIVQVENQAHICHSSTVPSLGTSFGRGGATTFQQDLMNADVITIMGSNMAENHPVGFQWVLEARERGAEVIHVDPRFTRTSAMATKHVGIRAGSDIAFLGGVIRYIIENERYFEEYVKTYTNAPTIIDEGFQDTEDLDGLFSGWDPADGKYDNETWQYEGMEATASAGAPPKGEQAGHGGAGGKLAHGE